MRYTLVTLGIFAECLDFHLKLGDWQTGSRGRRKDRARVHYTHSFFVLAMLFDAALVVAHDIHKIVGGGHC